jgi:uncharacterized protein (DUF433 family)
MGTDSVLGKGVYTTPEAARLLRVPVSSIRRWLNGYTYREGANRKSGHRLWDGDLEQIDGHYALSFLDLMEARCVDAFRKMGCNWSTIRKAHERAQNDLGTAHPFCTLRFKSDGITILRDLAQFGQEPGLDEICSRQRLFDTFMRHAVSGVEFDGETISHWFPLGQQRQVVLDPKRAFGRPIVREEGVATSVLAAAVKAGDTPERVQWAYEVSAAALLDAVEFEANLAA